MVQAGEDGVMLRPGSYQVHVNNDDGSRTTHTVDILPGQTTTFDPSNVGN